MSELRDDSLEQQGTVPEVRDCPRSRAHQEPYETGDNAADTVCWQGVRSLRELELPGQYPADSGLPTRDSKQRDWRTPLILTLTVHLMVFTLVINHRLFVPMERPSPGPYTMQVGLDDGDNPDKEQADDDGAAPGDPAEDNNTDAASLADAFKTLETPDLKPRPEREQQVNESVEQQPSDDRTLSERLDATVKAVGGSDSSDVADPVKPGGGSHGLRGAARHGIGLARHGGSSDTEDAVHEGLAWLARVQDDDGKWDSDGYMRHYLPNTDPNERMQEGVGLARNDLGLTGLCLLAFTGAGHTDRDGRFKGTVRRAQTWLLAQQRVVDGGFGLESDDRRITMYGHTLATFALTDLYLTNGDERLRTPARRGLEYLLSMQGPGGGWDYTQRYPDMRDRYESSTRNDLSISGWAVLTLIAAREANFEIPDENMRRLAGYLRECTHADGTAVYANEGTRAGHRGMAMLATSNVARRLLGEPGDSPVQQKQLEAMAKSPPDWSNAGELFGSNMYYWYYGSIAMLLNKEDGGHDRWRQWNNSLKKTLLDNQEQAGARRGSFKPAGHWARHGGGRVYSTALCILNLEIYYRYEPEYLRVRSRELEWLWNSE